MTAYTNPRMQATIETGRMESSGLRRPSPSRPTANAANCEGKTKLKFPRRRLSDSGKERYREAMRACLRPHLAALAGDFRLETYWPFGRIVGLPD
jgi:hypothetical protein